MSLRRKTNSCHNVIANELLLFYSLLICLRNTVVSHMCTNRIACNDYIKHRVWNSNWIWKAKTQHETEWWGPVRVFYDLQVYECLKNVAFSRNVSVNKLNCPWKGLGLHFCCTLTKIKKSTLLTSHPYLRHTFLQLKFLKVTPVRNEQSEQANAMDDMSSSTATRHDPAGTQRHKMLILC